MTRTIAIIVLASMLAACAGSGQAPANLNQTSNPYYRPGIPQSQYECVTDEGYGRYVPCGNKM